MRHHPGVAPRLAATAAGSDITAIGVHLSYGAETRVGNAVVFCEAQLARYLAVCPVDRDGDKSRRFVVPDTNGHPDGVVVHRHAASVVVMAGQGQQERGCPRCDGDVNYVDALMSGEIELVHAVYVRVHHSTLRPVGRADIQGLVGPVRTRVDGRLEGNDPVGLFPQYRYDLVARFHKQPRIDVFVRGDGIRQPVCGELNGGNRPCCAVRGVVRLLVVGIGDERDHAVFVRYGRQHDGRVRVGYDIAPARELGDAPVVVPGHHVRAGIVLPERPQVPGEVCMVSQHLKAGGRGCLLEKR